jgi:ribose transport system ATP-binding protein
MDTIEKIADDVAVETALALTGITKSFPGVRALDNVALSVKRGEVHGIVGENGAGKSTLMAITSGALQADEGTVFVLGKELTSANPELARELGIAIVRQEPALMPDLSVAENLYLAVTPELRPSPRNIIPWAEKALAVWGEGLTVKAQSRVEQLNPQQRFIVEICRALAQQPDVLILDEPTEHLLGNEVQILFGHIKRLVALGTAVVYISHRIPEVKSISDRITVLRNGQTIGTFEARDLSEDQIVKLIIGRELDVFFPNKGIIDLAQAPGLKITDLSSRGLHRINLEVRPGEIVGLAGIEGNGQKNLLRALAGLDPSDGLIEIGSIQTRRIDQASAVKNGIVYLTGDRHQEGLLSGLNVGENVAFRSLKRLSTGGWLGNAKPRELGRKVVADFNVKTPSLETPIESLSGGNQQKALLGGALVTNPKIFLVEEPTQGVDVGAKSEIYALLRQAAEAGAIVIVLASSALELAGLADRVLVFSRGQVIRELVGTAISEESITGAALMSDTERIRVVSTDHDKKVSPINWLAGDSAPVYVVGGLVLLLTLVSFLVNPLFLGNTNISGILMLSAPLALVAFGQLFVLLTGGIDLSTGPLMGLVAIIGSFYLVDGVTPLSQGLGWIVIIVAAAAIGLINWAFIDLLKLSPIIATLITYISIQALSFTLRPTRGGVISPTVTEPLRLIIGPISIAFVAAVLIGILLNYGLKKSRLGIALRAVGSREESARVNGLNPRLIRLFAYLSCSLLAGLAGVLLMAQTGTGDPASGLTYTLIGITAAVLGGASLFGGRGSFLGIIVGAILINVVSAMTVFLGLSSDWQYYLLGLMTIGAVALYSIARKKTAARH